MKTTSIVIISVLLLVAQPLALEAQATKAVLNAAGKVFRGKGGLAAITGVGVGGAAAFDQYLGQGEAVYALQLDLKNDASSIKWADIFSKPDVFPILQVAGIGNYLIPEIAKNYAGGKLIWTFKIPQIPAGRDLSVIIYDDDTTSDHIWQNILSTRWSVSVGITIPIEMTGGIPVHGGVGGDIQFINENVTINAPEQIAIYSIKTPRFYFGGDWDSIGDLFDGSGRQVGAIKLSMLRNK
jgi:hypothetical protein